MSITITGKHMEVGGSLKNHITDELTSLQVRYFGEMHETIVVVTKDTHHHIRTDITIHVGKSVSVHCFGSDTDAYKSVAACLEKVEERIRRYKTRLRDRKRQMDHEHRSELVQKFVLKAQEEDTSEDNPVIIAETSSEIHTLSVGDAVMRMDLSDAPAVLFRNAGNGELNLVYRRTDGHIGWVDPSRKMA